jgi:hypothetical protein
MPVLLRKSKDWCLKDSRTAVDRFHAMARQNGSEAKWLTQTCALVTNSDDESDKNFPYEKWRDEALK